MRVALSKRSERVIRLSSCILRLTSKRSEAQPSRKKAAAKIRMKTPFFFLRCVTRGARARRAYLFFARFCCHICSPASQSAQTGSDRLGSARLGESRASRSRLNSIESNRRPISRFLSFARARGGTIFHEKISPAAPFPSRASIATSFAPIRDCSFSENK